MTRTGRFTAAVAASAALLLALAGCSYGSHSDAKSSSSASSTASGSAAPGPCTSVKADSSTKEVKVCGNVGAAPTVTIPSGFSASKEGVKAVTSGNGTKAGSGRTVIVAFAFYDGTTGKEITTQGYTGNQPYSFELGQAIPALNDLFKDQKVGSRLLLSTPASDAFGADVDVTQYSVKAGDTVVFVGDLLGVVPNISNTAQAKGKEVKPEDGFPTATFASSGQPTVTIPQGMAAPTKTKVEKLLQGSGATVKDGDFVTVQYQGVAWSTGKVFDQSWGRAVATFQTSQVVTGFKDALVGQKVNSRVLVVIPPADGYGDNPPSGSGIAKDDSLIFVVDILATTSVK